MSLIADANGVVTGKFTIPENIPAGTKLVQFLGAASGGTRGSAKFTGQGSLRTETFQAVTTRTQAVTSTLDAIFDPLAQTFTLERDVQLAGVDLYFTAKGGDARVQLRATQNGYPTQTVLADVVIHLADMKIDGSHTRVLWSSPVLVSGGTECAVVVLADDAETALAIAELGKYDSTAQTWVTSQPYTVGTLLSSSNASTWTAHQDKDLAFRLLEADFSAALREVDLGAVTLNGATDLMVVSLAESPSAATRLEFDFALPSGGNLRVAPGQLVRVNAGVTGSMGIKARLSGAAGASPVLWPGSQVISGALRASADYVTRSIAAEGATKALLIYDAVIPSGADVVPRIRRDDGAWQALSSDGTTQQGDGLVEYRWRTTLSAVAEIKAKLTLSGTPAARPRVSNIRFMAVI